MNLTLPLTLVKEGILMFIELPWIFDEALFDYKSISPTVKLENVIAVGSNSTTVTNYVASATML